MIAAYLKWVLERTWPLLAGAVLFAFLEASVLTFVLPEMGEFHFGFAASTALLAFSSGMSFCEQRLMKFNARALTVLPMDRRHGSRSIWALFVLLLPTLLAFVEGMAWILNGGSAFFSFGRVTNLLLHWLVLMGAGALFSIVIAVREHAEPRALVKMLQYCVVILMAGAWLATVAMLREEPVDFYPRLLFLTGAAFSIPLVWLSYRLAPLAWSPQTRFRSAKVEWFSNVGHARPQELQRPAGGGFLALGAVGLAAGFAVASLIAAVAALTSVLYSASDTPEFPRLLICCFAGLFALDGHRLDPRATRSLPRSRTGIANLHAGTILLSFIPGLLLAPVFTILFDIPFLVPASLLALVAGLNVMWRGFTLGLDRSVERVCTIVVICLAVLGLPNFPPSPAAFFILAILLTTGGWSLIRRLLNESYVYQKAWEPESSQ